MLPGVKSNVVIGPPWGRDRSEDDTRKESPMDDGKKVISLVPKEAACDPDIIKRIEELLEDAKSGNVTGIAFAVTRADRGTASGYAVAANCNLMTLMGSLQMVNARLLYKAQNED